MVFFLESLQNKRSRNEDSYCHMDLRLNHEATVSAFVVADGMGGLNAGNLYSRTAVDLWYEELLRLIMGETFQGCPLKSQIDALKDFSVKVYHKLNKILYQKGMDAGLRGGTTLTTAIHFWDTWILTNLGDSPIYYMKEGSLKMASEIQNVAWQLVRSGQTQPGATLFLQNKNRLLQYLGRREEVSPHCVCLPDREIRMLLLGSDGAFGNLSEKKLEEILRQYEGSSQALSMILQAARDDGETDNQTAILIDCPEAEAQDSVREVKPLSALKEEAGIYRTLQEDEKVDNIVDRLKKLLMQGGHKK